jgi:hypothetical protein
LFVALAALVGGYGLFTNTLSGTAAALANATQAAAAETETVAAYNPTPSPVPPTATPLPTAVPTLAAGEIAKIFKGEQLLRPVFDDQKPLAAPPGQNWYVAVKHRQDQQGTGNIYMTGGSQLLFSAVTDSRFQLKVLSGGADLFFQTGPYNNGAVIELAGVSVLSSVQGCMAAYYPDNSTLVADCFAGKCAISINFGSDYTAVESGHQAKLDIAKLHLSDEGSIPPPDLNKYFSLLNETSAGRDDLGRCNVPNISATATAQVATQRAAAAAAAAQATQRAVAAAATQECQRLQSLGTPCP